jgi:hypothetical protein
MGWLLTAHVRRYHQHYHWATESYRAQSREAVCPRIPIRPRLPNRRTPAAILSCSGSVATLASRLEVSSPIRATEWEVATLPRSPKAQGSTHVVV